jgi:DNA-binding SARP family transcriptional activator/predicted ATPase
MSAALPSPVLTVRLFGRCDVAYGDAPVRIGLAKAVLVLAYLALHRHGSVARERIAAVLWPDDDEATARENLRRHVYRLLRALPAAPTATPWIVADATSLRWNAQAPAIVDVDAFERTAAPVEALAWYRGDLLDDVSDDWVFGERERLRAVATQRYDDAIAAARARGDGGAAIALAGGLLGHDPFREDAVRLAMQLRYEAGDRAGALRTYETFAVRLAQELDVQPMRETRDAYERLRADAPPAAAPAATIGASTPADGGLLPFVGRTRDGETLREWWSRARQGRGHAALLGGGAGVGKTRLLAEFAREVEAGGGRVIVGTTSAPEAVPYEAIVGALAHVADDLMRDLGAAWLAALAPLVPGVRARHGAPLVALPPDHERARLMEGVVRALVRLADAAPLFVILEDVHWAGDATLALFEAIAARIRRVPIFIVATYRDEETRGMHPLAAMRRRMRASRTLAHHTLMPLSLADVRGLVDVLPKRGGDRDARARALFERSDGNALFLGELVRERERSDAPHDIAELVDVRIAALPDASRTLLETAATAGRTFSLETIVAASGWSEAETLAALDDLIDAALVRDAAGAGGMDYAFTHHVMHDVAYARIDPARRRRRHHRIAHVLAGRGAAAEPAELARHADLGGDVARAATAYFAAAERAGRLGAVDEAIAAATRGIALATDATLLRALHRAREAYLHRAGRRAEQRAEIDRISAFAEEANDDDARCDAIARRIGLHHALSERAEERAAIDRLATLAARTSRAWTAHADEARGTLLRELGDYAAAEPALLAALATYGERGDFPAEVRTRATLAESYALHTRLSDADREARRALADAERAANPSLRARALAVNTFVALFQNDYERARDTAHATLALCRTLGDADAMADAYARLGYAEARRFDVDAAEAAYDEAVAEYRRRGSRFGEALAVLVRGQFRATCGDLDGAASALGIARPLVDALADPYLGTIWELDAAMLALCRGERPAAARHAGRGRDLAERVGSAQLHGTALGYLALARNDATLAVEALAMRRASGQRVDLGFHLAVAAQTAADRGELAAALDLAREIVTLDDATLRSERFPYFVLATAARILDGTAGAAPLVRAETFRDRRMERLAPERREAYATLRFNRPTVRRVRAR